MISLEEETNLEGIVTEVIRSDKEESVLKLKVGEAEKTVKASVKLHPKILTGAKVAYTTMKHTSTNYLTVGFETHAGEPSPIREPYTTTCTSHCIEVLEGDFEGIKYEWRDFKRKKGYEA